MDEWIKLTEYNWTLWLAGLFVLIEFLKWIYTSGEWIISKFGVETKRMRNQKENRKRLLNAENDIKEIKETSERNVNNFLEHEQLMSDNFIDVKNEIIREIGKLNEKIDNQREHLEEIDRDGKHRDMALMRDRLIQGLRYFSQKKDTDGSVLISMTDYENLDELFNEYFKCGGNGVCHSLYENEFKKFKIDTERKY